MVTVKQHYLGCLAQASYVITSNQQSFVIDPRRDVQLYLDEASAEKNTIIGIMITHIHADFVAGHQELAELTNAPIYIGKQAGTEYDHRAIQQDMELTFGNAKIVFWETPGHTPGDISTVLYDLEKDPHHPIAVFTGDTLFNGDVGRPDLLASFGLQSDELASMLYDSLHKKILTLPDDTILYPGHGEGSLCGKNLAETCESTIGEQRKNNYALQAQSKAEFVNIVCLNQPTAPDYFLMDAVKNKQGVEPLLQVLEKIPALDYAAWKTTLGQKHVYYLDTRDNNDFSKNHLLGFTNISLDGQFATWAGIVLNQKWPVVFVCDDGDEEETMIRLARVGLDNIQGYLKGGFDMIPADVQRSSFKRVTATDAKRLIDHSPDAITIDMRSCTQREKAGIMAGATAYNFINYPHNLKSTLPPKDHPVFLFCNNGYQSPILASILKAQGYTDVIDIRGGFNSWVYAGLPTQKLTP